MHADAEFLDWDSASFFIEIPQILKIMFKKYAKPVKKDIQNYAKDANTE
jgi:hypothetical protein